MATADEILHEVTAAGRQLRDAIPDVYSGYARLSAAAMAEGGELPVKTRELIALAIAVTRELIALAIAVTRECDGCIAAHARGAAGQGATAGEVAETLGVAILMNGGPGTVWAPSAYAAFQEYATEK
jgi:AhpD family alkylhydroperoxidase